MAHAIMLQTDEILVKPMNVPALIDAIKQRLASGPASYTVSRERCHDSGTLHGEQHSGLVQRVEQEETLMADLELRCGHLTQVL